MNSKEDEALKTYVTFNTYIKTTHMCAPSTSAFLIQLTVILL